MVRTSEYILERLKTFTEAALTGKYVSKDLAATRRATCQSCDQYDSTNKICGICGCSIPGIKAPLIREISSLAAYEENLPKWGCKHPLRDKGKGWQE